MSSSRREQRRIEVLADRLDDLSQGCFLQDNHDPHVLKLPSILMVGACGRFQDLSG